MCYMCKVGYTGSMLMYCVYFRLPMNDNQRISMIRQQLVNAGVRLLVYVFVLCC